MLGRVGRQGSLCRSLGLHLLLDSSFLMQLLVLAGPELKLWVMLPRMLSMQLSVSDTVPMYVIHELLHALAGCHHVRDHHIIKMLQQYCIIESPACVCRMLHSKYVQGAPRELPDSCANCRVRWRQGTEQTVAYLSPASAFARVLTGVPQIIGGGRFFDKAGNRVPQPGATYDSSGVWQALEQLTHSD